MTQEQLAEFLYCKKSLISQYENGKVDIKGSVIIELANILDTSPGYLLNGEKDNCLSDDERELLDLFSRVRDDRLRKVAIEQLRAISRICEASNE